MTTKSSKSPAKKRYYTAASANKALPLVRSIVADVVQRFQELAVLRDRLTLLDHTRRDALPPAHREEVEQVERECEQKADALNELAGELQELGVELKGTDGLVDFPALLDGREVHLCWRHGEAEVAYWHECDAGFAGRQPLTAEPRLCGSSS